MTSMRTLNRRLARWRRYAVKTGWTPDWPALIDYKAPPGWDRAIGAQQLEWERRNPGWRDGLNDRWWAEL